MIYYVLKLSNEYKVEIISKIENFFDKKIEAMFVDKINQLLFIIIEY